MLSQGGLWQKNTPRSTQTDEVLLSLTHLKDNLGGKQSDGQKHKLRGQPAWSKFFALDQFLTY